MTSSPITIRPWEPTDDVDGLTAMIHRAYAGLADQGFRYHATWQDAATTQHRLNQGVPFVAVQNEVVVGTITLYVPPNVSGCDWYDRGDVACFGQFGVEPHLQRHGIGSQLLDTIESETRRRGIPNLSLDTAEEATHLVEMYTRHGFTKIGTVDWEITNYRSILMNKPMLKHES